MKILGYKQCNRDHKLFYQHFPIGGVIIQIVYVDDIIITRNNDLQATKLKEHLTSHFEVKKLEPVKYLMGIEIAQSTDEYLMTQKKYILDLLNEIGLTYRKISKTPVEINHKLTLKEDDPKIEINSYQKLTGKSLYPAHTRPDISYFVNVLSQFMHNRRRTIIRQHLRYLDI